MERCLLGTCDIPRVFSVVCCAKLAKEYTPTCQYEHVLSQLPSLKPNPSYLREYFFGEHSTAWATSETTSSSCVTKKPLLVEESHLASGKKVVVASAE